MKEQIFENTQTNNNDNASNPAGNPPADPNPQSNVQNPHMQNYHTPNSPMQNPQIDPRASYNETDRIFSIIALIIGFTALKVLLHVFKGLMATVLCVSLTLFNFFYSRKKGMHGSKENTVIFYVTLFLSLMFVITDNSFVKTINFGLVLVSNMYFVYSGYKSNNNSIVLNVLNSIFLSPLCKFGSLFEALFQKQKKTSKIPSAEKKKIMQTAIGFILSLPLCIVVMVLLISSDQNFGRGLDVIFSRIINWFFDYFFFNIIQLVFSLPIAMYIFGAVFSRAYNMKYENELPKPPNYNMRIFPSSMCNAFLSPLIVIYIAFVFTQASYLFTTYGIANETFDYSEYARRGFFELCAVAIINLTVISIIIFFVKLKDKALPKSVKIFIISFSVLTLCLIVTAVVKMMMYINMYGMTPLRVYTSIFMIYLFVMFVVMIVKQFFFKISFTKIAYVLAVLVVAAMSIIPVDRCIAEYNIEMYINGEIEWMGYSAMDQLDLSAVSAFAECDPKFAYQIIDNDTLVYPIEKYFRSMYAIGDMNIYNFNFTRFFAAKEVENYNYQYDLGIIGIF